MGSLFTKTYGSPISHNIKTKKDKVALKKISDRKAYEFYGRSYPQLTREQQKHIFGKALRLYRQGVRE